GGVSRRLRPCQDYPGASAPAGPLYGSRPQSSKWRVFAHSPAATIGANREVPTMNILVVDDHPLYRSGVVHTLQNTRMDVAVVECAALDTAFQRIEAGLQVDLMILDLQMPGYQGTDSVRTVRARRPEVPVLVLSGNEDPSVVRDCIDLGACGFVPKSAPSDE